MTVDELIERHPGLVKSVCKQCGCITVMEGRDFLIDRNGVAWDYLDDKGNVQNIKNSIHVREVTKDE